jgi:hypothetical protein
MNTMQDLRDHSRFTDQGAEPLKEFQPLAARRFTHKPGL